ncbi:4-hydroxyphenylacetate 3-monooxygenase, oxygenase component [Lottiidibacillus patelloidae]|uniref:4-hydroxyphenylacetate 3-monooxygenase, oxygenase component n=1 Tax=Lottiidibacillus patelloidae TaxID=2670334 RepID=A0A263BX04_9BACI|nr:4-hydroxyphenylacetate 3-monooxygenase, oxygenase component [Lottiidibacillus patelloidae]OZM58200.1 4-hydroxyphenylacetate 3-monooxygenase, oxygenase component [Lottiidibacillus patelloidae]
MGARTGKEYIEGLKKRKSEVWIDGKKVDDITEHKAFKNVVKSMANLYDLQHEKEDKMLYTSPSTGDKVGLSFIAPKTKEDLIRRREMMMEWSRFNGGMMGRTPDYLNTSVMAFGTASSFFAQSDPMYAKNAADYYEYCRENDISLTHTLIHPQVNRSKTQAEQKDPHLSAKITKKDNDGIYVSGCRLLATQGGITDEIVVFPSTLNKSSSKDDPYSMAFGIPNNTPGLKFISRESFDYGKGTFDHPLGARFEEGDAIVVFDDVFVPWERVFVCEDASICNRTYGETNAVIHMAHQVIAKNTAKTEFILGIVLSMIDAIGIEKFQHVKEKASEIMVILETMKSHFFRAEHNAKMDQYGNMTPDFAPLNAARNWYPKMYQRLVEIVKILGASGLMGIPTQADFDSEEIGHLVHRYMQGANIDGYEKIQLFRLAWDVTMSAFGSRQALYEYYFFGDPVRMSNVYYDAYDKDPYKEMISEFLQRTKDTASV